MPFDFGNIYAMSQNDFETAIDYYRSRIELITNDETVSVAVKRWFIKRYNEKIKKLNKANQKLQETINRIKASGVYVDENSATLNSLNGTYSSDRKAFRNLGVGKARHNIAQILRIVGAVCLPLIGSIPFGIAFHRSRKRYRLRQQENIELNRFVNDSNRTFDAGLTTSTPFTEKEMQDLLNTPSELSRLTNLTSPTNTTLTPDQKKNLIKKLVTLKAYAQKHGFSTAGLSDPKFNTSADKVDGDHRAITSAPPSNLKQAHEKIEQLKAIKIEAEALLEADKDNDHLKSLISNIDSAITSFTSTATGFVSTALSDIDSGLVAPSATDKASLEASNTGLDATYNTPHAKLGVDLATAKTLASALGIDTSGFAPVTNKYSNLKSSNNDKLSKINEIEGFNNNLTTAETLLDELDSLTLTDVASISEAVGRLALIETKLNAVKAYALTLPASDPIALKYRTLNTRYLHKQQIIEEKQRDIAISESDFDTYKTIIDNNLPKISKPYDSLNDDDLSTLAAKKARLLDAKTALDSDDFKRMFASNYIVLDREIQRATDNIAAIDTQIEFLKKEEHKKEADAKLDPYKTLFNSNKYNPSDGAIELKTKHDSLKDIIDAINKDSFKVGIEDVVDSFVIEIKNQLTTIEYHLDEYVKIKTLLDKAKNQIDKICKPNRKNLPSVAEVDAIADIKAKLPSLLADAIRWGLDSDLNSIVSRAEGFLSHYTVSGLTKEDKKVERI